MIAVGRLGDPAIAAEAVAAGSTDFVALGRTLIADPQWVAKVSRGEPIRRCLACNTCINEMRGGARIGCVVNGAAGRETTFAYPKPPRGERIAVIGAGPAGLTYASLVAEGNEVTVFEKENVPGGAFRYAGKAPLFQEVAASERSFERYIADLVADCTRKGVEFWFDTDVAEQPRLLASYDRIVIATGAQYRYGLGPIATTLLDRGVGRWPGFSRLFSLPAFRDWFYYKASPAERPTASRGLAKPGQTVVAIGDAMQAGKSKHGDCERVRGGAAGLTARGAAHSVNSLSPLCGERVGVRGNVNELSAGRVPLTRRASARRPLPASGERLEPVAPTAALIRDQQLRHRHRDDLGRGAQIVQPQILVGVMRVGLEDRARSRAIEHDRNSRRRVVAGIGIERHAGHRHIDAQNIAWHGAGSRPRSGRRPAAA